MDNGGAGRFFRREHELHQTAVGRVLWRHVRGGRSGLVHGPREQHGYETAYRVDRGYAEERVVLGGADGAEATLEGRT